MKSIIFLGITFIFSIGLQAQFTIDGGVIRTSTSCYELTQDSIIGFGKITSNRPLSLEEPLTLYTELFFGEEDSGGNGISFFFQSNNEIDASLDTLYGIGNNTLSLNVEFDTYENIEQGIGDPLFDHIAVSVNGDFNHNSINNLEGPIISNPSGNIEDDAWHQVKIDWQPATNMFSVWFDCELKIQLQIDLVNEVFEGNANVFYGFSAGSFQSFNNQQVCIEISSLTDRLEDVVLCKGGTAILNAIAGAESYLWSPAEGLNVATAANVVASPEISTAYLLEIETGYCDETLVHTVNVTVDSTFAQVDLGPNQELCSGDEIILDATIPNATNYAWSTGSTDTSILANRTRLYVVTVTVNEICVVEDGVVIRFNDPPQVFFGNDTTICQRSGGFILRPFVDASVDFVWNDGSTGDSLIVNREGLYIVSIENDCGSDEASIFVTSEDCQNFFMPNAFSPNLDGINDRIFPFGETPGVTQIVSYRIYDRWGNQVHSIENGIPNQPEIGWDGVYKNEPAIPGVYVYEIIFQFRDGQQSLIKGDFTLFK